MRGVPFNEKRAIQELSPERRKYPSSSSKYLLNFRNTSLRLIHPRDLTGTNK